MTVQTCVVGMVLLASCGGSGTHLWVSPSICTLTKAATAVVQCQVTAIGGTITAQEAGLEISPSQTMPIETAGDGMAQVTITAFAPIEGTLAGNVSLFAFPWDANVTNPTGPQYADGTLASGYCFLTQNNGKWVLESSGFFRQAEQQPSQLYNDNLYLLGIRQQDLLNTVTMSAQPATSCGAPIAPPPIDGGQGA